jgi:hypothetical protein
MAGSITIASAQNNSITINFGESMTSGVSSIDDYVFAPATGYRQVYATEVVAVTGTQTYKVKVSPEFDVPGTYTVTCANARDAGNAALSTNNSTYTLAGHLLFQVPDGEVNYVDSSSNAHKTGNYIGVLEALTLAFGDAIQKTAGRPVTRLRKEYTLQTDSVMLIETTLSFPDSGYVYLGGQKLKYASKDTNCLYMDNTTIASDLAEGKLAVEPRKSFVSGSEVHLDVRSILPA